MMGGLLPDAALQLSAMAIYNSTNDLCFMVSNGMAVAVSTRQACTVTCIPVTDALQCGVSNTCKPECAAAFLYLLVLCACTYACRVANRFDHFIMHASFFLTLHLGTSKVRNLPAEEQELRSFQRMVLV